MTPDMSPYGSTNYIRFQGSGFTFSAKWLPCKSGQI